MPASLLRENGCEVVTVTSRVTLIVVVEVTEYQGKPLKKAHVVRLVRGRQADIVEERVPLRNRLALALAHQHPQVPDAGSSTQALDVALRLELIDVHNHAAAVVGAQRKELTRRA
eukprot:scaffold59838_cov73-Phaeocystis_antarctica.AAC.1